ncbi:hypothetical protein BOTBODRAFT_456610 [Botryobasidium botryosum FD-172 SS1]|uniref:Major facilitator superfamily (MFS) profile domain-containing protein n=1 Tax=Botryobasidium botryosum (strain FD-172 SS1) TaxID=930990 RepID=A0A067M9V8_BOTB1|nr:hypothetical protein BOTBODRAFT_456610 [Botryobasidium botryosum FD-172 SS1]
MRDNYHYALISMSSPNSSREHLHTRTVSDSTDHGKVPSVRAVEHAPPKPTGAAERQQRLAEALAVDPGVEPWSWRAVQTTLIILCACLCADDNGFDGTVMSGINSMAQFQEYFGLKSAGAKTGIIFGIYTIGSLCTALPAGI